MRYAVMSDAHANPLALKTALADARRRRCRKFLFLGDTTGYGYAVKETLRLIREKFDVVLMGNHDSACVGLEPWLEVHMNRNYHVDLMNREELEEEEIRWLKNRPYLHVEGEAAFAHGDFTDPPVWNYIFGPQEAAASLAARKERILFCGHTHHAAAWEMDETGAVRFFYPVCEERQSATKTFPVKPGSRYVVNVGSVGYPRCDFCSTYVIYDTEAQRLTFRRLPIDILAYAEKLEAHGINLPFWLADAVCVLRETRETN